MLIEMAPADNERQTRLYAWLDDLGHASACAEHLKKKGWFRNPWARGNVYFHQSVYVTSLVMSYARPFAGSRGKPTFGVKAAGYNAEQKALHVKLLSLRSQVYAHSDVEHWNVRPWRSGSFETSIVGQPTLSLAPEEVDAVLAMIELVRRALGRERSDILSRYELPPPATI